MKLNRSIKRVVSSNNKTESLFIRKGSILSDFFLTVLSFKSPRCVGGGGGGLMSSSIVSVSRRVLGEGLCAPSP